MENMTIRLRREDDDPQIIAIRNEANPHFPPSSLEEYRYSADPSNSPPGFSERHVAERDDRILGLYVLNEITFFRRPFTFGANIGVAKGERGKGIGTALYNHMLERAKQNGATRLYGHVSEDSPDSLTFFETRGFSRTGRADRMSRLKVNEANLDGYDGVLETVAAGGIDIKTLSEIGLDKEPLLRKIHKMTSVSARDIPSSEEFGEFPFEIWMKWQNAPGNSPDQNWVALDADTPAGIATVSRRGDDAAFNNYTGVAREYRGRSIARALKLTTIEWARANGVNVIFTGNDVDNQRMLSINIPLGYKAVPSQVEIVKDL
jgi:mycothiol synthase